MGEMEIDFSQLAEETGGNLADNDTSSEVIRLHELLEEKEAELSDLRNVQGLGLLDPEVNEVRRKIARINQRLDELEEKPPELPEEQIMENLRRKADKLREEQ